jgi:hypothetical protein
MTYKNYYATYWEPYLSQYKYLKDYWFICDFPKTNDIYLKSPFINSIFNLEDEHLKNLDPMRTALSRKQSFEVMICSSDIRTVSVGIGMVEKHSRNNYLLNHFLKTSLAHKFTDEQIWNVIQEVWCDVEFPCSTKRERDIWKKIFSIRNRPDSLTSHLPEEIVVFRGGQDFGLSWSRDICVAKKFQSRNVLFSKKDVDLLKTTVFRDEILFEGVREDEIVIAPNCLDIKINKKLIEVIG